jgi:hypothetical protein
LASISAAPTTPVARSGSPPTERVLLDNAGGDALDAVIAAIATAHADIAREPTPDETIEGVIYG